MLYKVLKKIIKKLYNILSNILIPPEELQHVYKHDIWQIISKYVEVNIVCTKYKYSAYIKNYTIR